MVKICEKLGIDDPICWFNSVDPKVIDLWIAYYSIQEVSALKPAEQVLQGLAKTWQTPEDS